MKHPGARTGRHTAPAEAGTACAFQWDTTPVALSPHIYETSDTNVLLGENVVVWTINTLPRIFFSCNCCGFQRGWHGITGQLTWHLKAKCENNGSKFPPESFLQNMGMTMCCGTQILSTLFWLRLSMWSYKHVRQMTPNIRGYVLGRAKTCAGPVVNVLAGTHQALLSMHVYFIFPGWGVTNKLWSLCE